MPPSDYTVTNSCHTCPYSERLPRSQSTSVCPRCGGKASRIKATGDRSDLPDLSRNVRTIPLRLRRFLDNSTAPSDSPKLISAATGISRHRLYSLRRGYYSNRHPCHPRHADLAALAAHFNCSIAVLQEALRLSWIHHAHRLGAVSVPTEPRRLRKFLSAFYRAAPA